MTMVKKSISVTDQQDEWIKVQILKGHYGNDSEVIRDLIRERQIKEEETSADIALIRKKLELADKSGFVDLSAKDILSEIKEDLRRDGRI